MDMHAFFADMALELHDQTSTVQTLDKITQYAKLATSCDDAGVLLVHARHRLETASSTSERVMQSHDLQRLHDEGPCLDALEGVGSYISGDVGGDSRWPAWGKAMSDMGIQSAMSVRLETRQRRFGSLNLYSERLHFFDQGDLETAKIFGRHVSVALSASHSEEGLLIAIDARKLIGQAQGILMERFDIDDDRAFEVLRRYSQHHNAKLRAVAEWVVRNRRSPMSDFSTYSATKVNSPGKN